MNIRDVDLNLLVIFRSLMLTLNVSKTAHEMNLSQPAVSHALNRLRRDLGDDLLVRSSHSMIPTPYAYELEVNVVELLNELERVLTRKSFDPKTAEGIVRIQSTEYFEQLVLPLIFDRLVKQAPKIQIINSSTGGRLPTAELRQGGCDLAIAGFFGELPENMIQQKIFRDRLVCLCSGEIPGKMGSKMPLEKFLMLNHVLVSPEGQLQGTVDQILQKLGSKRKVMASISGFSAPARFCQNREFACTLPEKLARLYTEVYPLKWFELPFETKPIQVVQVWHERTQRDPITKFVRSLIAEVSALV